MMKNKNQLFKQLFAIAFIVSLVGVIFKINHWSYSDEFLVISIMATLVYVGIGIYEVNQSKKLTGFYKFIWTLTFVFFSFFAGLYYFAVKRKEIV